MEIWHFLKDVGNQTILMTVDLTIDAEKNTETSQNIFYYVPQKKVNQTGLIQHEGQ